MEELKPCPFCGGEAEIGFSRSCYNHWKPEGFYQDAKIRSVLGEYTASITQNKRR